MSVIIPKTFVPDWGGTPLFAFLGPVRGGGDWQYRAYLYLQDLSEGNSCAFIPVRYRKEHPEHPILAEALSGDENKFASQTLQERFYIEMAARPRNTARGCVMFWLGLESTEHPHPGPEPYAMDSRGELGRWSVHKKYDPSVRLVVGAHPEFLGLRTIQRNLNADLGYEFPIYSTLEETVEAAVDVAR